MFMLARAMQTALFGAGSPRIDPSCHRASRIHLGRGAWIERVPGWLAGHGVVLDQLARTTCWQHKRRKMYDREVDVPRMLAVLPEDGPGHPVLGQVSAVLSARYGQELDRVALACYRDGRDSVAFHGDRVDERAEHVIIAVLSLGDPRPFQMRPKGGRLAYSFLSGWGDLLVMGGTCQSTWEHAVPKVARAGLRMSVQFRPGAYAR